MLALYLLTLGASAGLVGLFGYELMSGYGYAPSSEAGLMVTAAAAAAYVATQAVYLLFVRVLHPTKDAAPFGLEALGHLTAFLLLPYVLGLEIEWPHPKLEPFEPLIYLAAFGLAHSIAKLVSYFAFVSGRKTGRLGALGWAALLAASAVGTQASFARWTAELDAARPLYDAGETARLHAGAYARAHLLGEGVILGEELQPHGGACALTLRFAPEGAPEEAPSKVYVAAYLYGDKTTRVERLVRLQPNRWAELRVSGDDVPANLTRCEVLWGVDEEPPWQRLTGFRSVSSSSRKLWVSGPHIHLARGDEAPPNLILVTVDGLGADYLSGAGDDRDAAPRLNSFGAGTLAMTNAYTPIADPAGAAITLLTGLHPLRHGYLGAGTGEIPPSTRTLPEILAEHGYATAAFVESGEGPAVPLGYGSGPERGFELYNVDYRSVAPEARDGDSDAIEVAAGSAVTLRLAREWIEAQGDVAFCAYLRLHELAELRDQPRYAREPVAGEGEPLPGDVYASALSYLDGHLGAFIKAFRDSDARKHTILAIVGAYGIDLAQKDRPVVGVTEASLHVPVYIYIPGKEALERTDLVGLEDLAPTLLRMLNVPSVGEIDGRDFSERPNGNEPLALQAKRLAVSIRSGPWRFTLWPEAVEGMPPKEELYDVTRPPGQRSDEAPLNPLVVRKFEQRAANASQRLRALLGNDAKGR